MQDQYSRTQLLLGAEAMEKLHRARVAVFGIGGVGGYTVEALARSGVGALDLIDDDKVCLTNLNRQIIATRSTVGQYKVDVAEQRIHDIDPNIKVTTHRCFFGPETQDEFDFTQYDYVVDAIDTVTGKLALVMKCKEAGTPIICSMGAGNKMDPTRFEVTDIYKTSVCPLAKVMRTECRKRKIKHLKVVYSKEPAMTPIEDDSISCKNHCICPPGTQRKCTVRRTVPGSNAFVPSVAGLIIGGEVVKDLVGFVPLKGKTDRSFLAAWDDLECAPRCSAHKSRKKIFIILEYRSVCGRSGIPFSRVESWRKTAFAAPLSAKARRCGRALAPPWGSCRAATEGL